MTLHGILWPGNVLFPSQDHLQNQTRLFKATKNPRYIKFGEFRVHCVWVDANDINPVYPSSKVLPHLIENSSCFRKATFRTWKRSSRLPDPAHQTRISNREADNNLASCLWHYDMEGWLACITPLILPDVTFTGTEHPKLSRFLEPVVFGQWMVLMAPPLPRQTHIWVFD